MTHDTKKPEQKIEHASESKTIWTESDYPSDEEIAEQVRNDPDSAPILTTEERLRQYKIHPPRIPPLRKEEH